MRIRGGGGHLKRARSADGIAHHDQPLSLNAIQDGLCHFLQRVAKGVDRRCIDSGGPELFDYRRPNVTTEWQRM